jgi:hypothetical protein
MNLRPLSLCVLCLGLLAGCAKQSPSSEAPMTDSSKPTQTESPSGGTPDPQAGGAGKGQQAAYIVRNSGIRCIAPPCPSYLAQPVAQPDVDAIQIHEIDFSALNASEEQRAEFMHKADGTPEGLRVEAVLDKQLNAGPAGDATVLRVKKVLP